MKNLDEVAKEINTWVLGVGVCKHSPMCRCATCSLDGIRDVLLSIRNETIEETIEILDSHTFECARIGTSVGQLRHKICSLLERDNKE